MQLRTEETPAPTGAQEVGHEEVLVPGASNFSSTFATTPNPDDDREPNAVFGNLLVRNSAAKAPVTPFAVRGPDNRLLNMPTFDALKASTNVLQAIDEVRAVPIEVWEGEVKDVDAGSNVMHVYLRSKLRHAADHAAQISLEWVHPQDADLVRPGAVFYWTLYKETRRGSIRNSEELRFRRRPNWSQPRIDRIRAEAEKLFPEAKAPRIFEAP